MPDDLLCCISTCCVFESNLIRLIAPIDFFVTKQLIEMAGIDPSCWQECMSLGKHQRDHGGCRLRPDEGLDAIASLAPGSLGSDLLVGGTNTVYAWLIQWLAENLGYDVSSIVGLPYDWRLSPDVMEERDGYLTLTKHRIEAAVAANGGLPGIMVAHSVSHLELFIFEFVYLYSLNFIWFS